MTETVRIRIGNLREIHAHVPILEEGAEGWQALILVKDGEVKLHA